MGRVRIPAPKGECPCTNWKYCVSRKNMPNITKKESVIARLPMLKAGARKSRGSSMGKRERSSHQAKRARRTAAAAKRPKVTGSVQPTFGPSITA